MSASWQRDWPKSRPSPKVERAKRDFEQHAREQREQLEQAAYWRRQPWTPEPR